MSSPLESLLSDLLGSSIEVETAVPGSRFFLRIQGLDRPHGFRVDIERRFSWIEASLSFDRLSSHLRAQLAIALFTHSEQFDAAIAALAHKGVDYRRIPTPATRAGDSVEFQAFSSRVSLDSQPSVWEAERLSSVSILLPIVQLLDPQTREGDQETDPSSEYEEEGQVGYMLSRRYERSAANRALAIELHGRTCIVCGTNFDEVYGPIASGYVEIHHLIPVSSMGGPQIVDPRTDLVPLCANCHRMAHRKWPPFTPSELRAYRSRA